MVLPAKKSGFLNLGPRSESVEGTPVYAMRRKGGITPGGYVLWRAEPGLARRADDAFLCDAVAYRKGIRLVGTPASGPNGIEP